VKTWAEIAQRAQEAKGPDDRIDRAVFELSGLAWLESGGLLVPKPPLYTGSVDAVLKLIAWMLPGWQWLVHSPRGGLSFGASVQDPAPGGRVVVSEKRIASAALALLAALARAKAAEEARS
jgi:hypothetical protein